MKSDARSALNAAGESRIAIIEASVRVLRVLISVSFSCRLFLAGVGGATRPLFDRPTHPASAIRFRSPQQEQDRCQKKSVTFYRCPPLLPSPPRVSLRRASSRPPLH